MGNTHTIELNGRKYDAQTGREIKEGNSVSQQGQKQSIKSVDGFVTAKSHALRKVSGIKRQRPLKKSQTLMRTAVKKPKAAKTAQSKTDSHIIKTKPDVKRFSIPEQRKHRAASTKQSGHIRRFGNIAPAIKETAEHVKEASNKAAHEAMEAVSKQTSNAVHMGQTAVEHAISHTQPKVKTQSTLEKIAHKLKINTRVASTSAAVLAFVLLGGFFTYQNAPNLSMRVASMRSDVNGSLPGYLPSGYSLNGPIRYETGKIVFEYKSNTDNRGFAVTESKSAWDTASLRQNFVEPMNTAFQTVQSKGKTVYLYDDSNATWVDGGIWYKVEGQSKLSSEQLNKLVNSF